MERKTQIMRWRWTMLLALLGGNICGFVFDYDALFAALRHRPYHNGVGGVMAGVASLVGDMLLPAAVTMLAPRRSFLWGAVPLSLGLAWSLADRVAAHNWPGMVSDFYDNAPGSLVALVLICGPISLTRFIRKRRSELKAQQEVAVRKWQSIAAQPQEGVWPPPIQQDLK